MAIVIEEEKKGSNQAAVLGWLVVPVLAIVAVYYIFFAAPPAVVVPPSSTFETLVPFTHINIDPSGVLTNPTFQGLKSYVTEPTSTGPVPIGRANPFLPQ